MDKNGKILIVDDAKSNREILSEILNQYTVIEAKDGYEALEYLKSDSKSVALVLLDLVMPEMDGFEVLKYMNKNHLIEEVPVMIISIDKDDKSIEKAYELGVSGYITRPFSSANDDTYNNTEYKKELTETITKKTGIQNVTFGTCSHIGKDNAKYYVNFKNDDGKNVYSVIKRNKDITVSVN